MSPRKIIVATIVASGLALLAPTSAFAADFFVDKETGHDTTPTVNNCLNQADPCKTIGYAISLTSSGDTIKVDDTAGAYAETVSLDGGRSLAGVEFVGGDEGSVTIDSGSSSLGAIILNNANGTISGLRVRTSNAGKGINGAFGSVTAITGNVFDTTSDGIGVLISQGSPVISGNTFSSAIATADDAGLVVNGANPTVEDNLFQTLHSAIVVGSGTAAPNTIIRRNQITGVQTLPTAGVGITVNNSAGVLLEDNVLSQPSGSNSFGLEVQSVSGPASVTMRRNQVYGHALGLLEEDASSLTMNGDVIANSTNFGIEAVDTATAGSGDITATNVTLFNPAAAGNDVFLQDNTLTLDSSIISDKGISTTGTVTCTISRSRGSTTTPGGTGCANFQTTAVPNFVNAATNDFHLMASNATLIDAGDPAVPAAPNNLDLDGQKRNIDGDGNCTEIRDIGADELLPAAPTASITAGPLTGSTINTSTTSFSFTNSNTCPSASFQCSLDGAVFSACSSPVNLGGLTDGAHTFAVRALDLVPQPGTAVSRNFTVDLPDPPPAPPASVGAPNTTPTPPTLTPTTTTAKKCKKKKKRSASAAKKCKKKKKK